MVAVAGSVVAVAVAEAVAEAALANTEDAHKGRPGGGTQNRTGDAGIFSPSLYRLSYPADKQSDYRLTARACKSE